MGIESSTDELMSCIKFTSFPSMKEKRGKKFLFPRSNWGWLSVMDIESTTDELMSCTKFMNCPSMEEKEGKSFESFLTHII